MTLRAQIESDVSAVFLQTNDFAETGSYLPKGGERRSVIAVVDLETQQADEPTGVSNIEILHLFVGRDATTGIDAPKLGDSFCREDDHDDDGNPLKLYAFAGVETDADQFAWTLTFQRKPQVERGGNRLQR